MGEAGQQLVQQALGAMQGCCPFSQALTLAHYSAVAADVKAGGPLGRLNNVMEVSAVALPCPALPCPALPPSPC